MICLHCQASQAEPTYSFYTPACLYCGARKIQRIQKFNLPKEVIVSRCRSALDAWVAHGHAESDIRRLAKSVNLVHTLNDKTTKKLI